MATEKRLLFKFYSSYFDIAQELNDNDRLSFYDALMKKQFTGIDTDLKGMANFAYISQKHSIDKQVEGWEFKMKTTLNQCITKPIKGGVVGCNAGGIKQEEGKEKEKEEVQVKEKEENDLQPTAKEKSFKNLSETEFYQTIKEFSEKYPSKMLREFFDYWREPMANKKMRMTGEKAWDLSRRLSTWNNRNSNKNSNGNNTINPTNTDGTRNLALARRR